MTILDFSLRIIVAVSLGAAIGLERQWRQRMAGLRTNALVAMGAAAFVTLSGMILNEPNPTRVAAQVVSGIGFLGGGVILRDGLTVRGLTTAATLWCSAAVGTLAGSGFLAAALISCAVVIGANVLLRPLGTLVSRRSLRASDGLSTYRLNATCAAQQEQYVRSLLLQAVSREALSLTALRSDQIQDSDRIRVQVDMRAIGRRDKLIEDLVSRLSLEPAVKAISWESADRNEQEYAS